MQPYQQVPGSAGSPTGRGPYRGSSTQVPYEAAYYGDGDPREPYSALTCGLHMRHDTLNWIGLALTVCGAVLVTASIVIVGVVSWVPWLIMVPPLVLSLWALIASFNKNKGALLGAFIVIFIFILWFLFAVIILIVAITDFNDEWNNCKDLDCVKFKPTGHWYCYDAAEKKCREVRTSNYLLMFGTFVLGLAGVIHLFGTYKRRRQLVFESRPPIGGSNVSYYPGQMGRGQAPMGYEQYGSPSHFSGPPGPGMR